MKLPSWYLLFKKVCRWESQSSLLFYLVKCLLLWAWSSCLKGVLDVYGKCNAVIIIEVYWMLEPCFIGIYKIVSILGDYES
jgi:hypothetical protein